MNIRLYHLLITLLMIPSFVYAQGQSQRHWFLHNQQWDFSKGGQFPQAPQNINALNTSGNTSVAIDGFTGDWYFYTDGQNFFYRDASGATQTVNLPQKSTNNNQRVVSAPENGNVGADYLFWVNNNGNLYQYRVAIDDATNTASAPVLDPATPIKTNVGPAMTVISQVAQGNTLLYLLIQNTTDRSLALLDISDNLNELERTETYGATFQNFEWTPPTTKQIPNPADPSGQPLTIFIAGKIALTPLSANNIFFADFWFEVDPAIGADQLISKADEEVFNRDAVSFYDTEWANDSTLLVSADNAILEVDINAMVSNGNYNNILEGTGANNIKGIQMGPDGFIYFLHGGNQLGRLRTTDDGRIIDRFIDINHTFGNGSAVSNNADQFPQFAPPRVENIQVALIPTDETICDKQKNQLHAEVTRNGAPISADNYFWLDDIGIAGVIPTFTPQDAPSGNANIAVEVGGVIYTGGGTYNTAQNELDENSIIKDTSQDLSQQQGGGGQGGGGGGNAVGMRYVQDTLMCAPPFVAWANDSNIDAVYWYNRSQNPSDSIMDPGNYWVKAYSGGCHVTATVQVRMIKEEDGGGYVNDTTQMDNIGQWYFGNTPGLDFNTDKFGDQAPQPITAEGLNMSAEDDVETVYDANGRAFFVTDGDRLWIATDTSGTNFQEVTGLKIGGDAQLGSSVAVVPVPEDDTKYYVFATKKKDNTPAESREYEVRYSLIDIATFDQNTRSIVIKAIANDILLMESASRRLISDNNYLIAHEYNNSNFRVFPVSAQGLGNPVISSVGRSHTDELLVNYGEIGIFDIPDVGQVTKVALAVKDENDGKNYLDLFDLNPKLNDYDSTLVTGDSAPAYIPTVGEDMLYNPIAVPLGEDALEAYGLEFNGNFVMVSLKGNGNSKVFGASLDYPIFRENAQDELKSEAEQINAIIKTTSDAGGTIGEISTAPNNTIYIANQNSTTLKEINGIGLTEGGQLNLTISDSQLTLDSNSKLGLPAFTLQGGSGSGGEPSLEAEDVCLGDSATFSLNMGDYYTTAPNYTLEWSFGDGNSAVIDSTTEATHLYANADTYFYIVNWKNHCSTGNYSFNPVLTDTITINPAVPDDQWGVLDGEKICQDKEFTAFIGDDTGFSISWENRGLPVFDTNTIQVDTENELFHNEFFLIKVEDPNGCLAEKEVFFESPLVDAGFPDSTYCKGTSDVILSSGISVLYDYRWAVENNPANTPNYGPKENKNTFPVDTDVPGDFVYYMEVTDPDDPTCMVEISAAIKVVDIYDEEPTITDATSCGDLGEAVFQQGNIPFDRLTFLWSPDAVNQTQASASTVTFEAESGGYTATLTDNLYKCETVVPVNIGNDDITFTLSIEENCSSANYGKITINGLADPGTYTIALKNVTTGDSTIVAINNILATNPGDYQVVAFKTATPSCQSAEGIKLKEPDLNLALSSEDLKGCIDTQGVAFNVSASGSDFSATSTFSGTYLPDNSTIVLQDGENFLTNENADSLMVTVKSNQCEVSKSIPVEISAGPEDFNIDRQGDKCDGEITLTADQPDYSYSWKDPLNNIVAQGATFIATVNAEVGDYTITARDKATGCTTEKTENIEIAQKIGLALTGKTRCEGSDEPINVASNTDSKFNEELSYEWFEGILPNGNKLNDSENTINYTGADSVVYLIATSTASQCKDTATFNILELKATLINPQVLGINPAYCFFDDEQIPLDSVIYPGKFETYEWFNLDNNNVISIEPALPIDENEDLIGQIEGTFNNAAGCPATMVFNVINRCTPTVVFPNAFAPKGNFTGDKAERGKIFSVEYEKNLDPNKFVIEIYNRWGEKIFRSDDYITFKEDGWDGFDRSGKEMPAGAYSYVVRFGSITENSPIEEKRGSVLLIR
ncbi:gliding motility-associated C-terminal domain-containing protein [Persicobacter psychrovividus]|uniref:PKD domain-containing protein n=1 Tax=Persicobacter psychrovividus TaxID=387638 RepID=A0ABM7VFD6_9BACT|nr:hypothetical protein PEPS_16690 [Persicobacter psychrovividus]